MEPWRLRLEPGSVCRPKVVDSFFTLMENWIRIRIKVNSRIRISIKVKVETGPELLWFRIRIKLKVRIWIRIRIKVVSWIRIKVIGWIRIRINLQMTSRNVRNMSLFEHFFFIKKLGYGSASK
jgi:hypothetical protein